MRLMETSVTLSTAEPEAAAPEAAAPEAAAAGSGSGSGSASRTRDRSSTTPGNVVISRDVSVKGVMEAQTVLTRNLTVTGSLAVSGEVTASRVSASVVSAETLSTGAISPRVGNTIVIDADLELSGDGSSLAFLATDVILGGVRQWRLISLDSFQNPKDAAAWSNPATGTCARGEAAGAASSDRHLGGHCAFAGHNSSRTFQRLPPHTQVMLTARFHFLDAWGLGETAFAAVDGDYVWAEAAPAAPSPALAARSLDVCGGPAPDARLSAPVHVSLPHSGNSLTVLFGSTLVGDACTASWAVDDVALYVR